MYFPIVLKTLVWRTECIVKLSSTLSSYSSCFVQDHPQNQSSVKYATKKPIFQLSVVPWEQLDLFVRLDFWQFLGEKNGSFVSLLTSFKRQMAYMFFVLFSFPSAQLSEFRSQGGLVYISLYYCVISAIIFLLCYLELSSSPLVRVFTLLSVHSACTSLDAKCFTLHERDDYLWEDDHHHLTYDGCPCYTEIPSSLLVRS